MVKMSPTGKVFQFRVRRYNETCSRRGRFVAPLYQALSSPTLENRSLGRLGSLSDGGAN